MESAGTLRTMTRAGTESREFAETEFEYVFLEHYPKVVSILSRFASDRAHAEELANHVFWKLYQQPVRMLLDGDAAGWLYKVAVRTGIDAVRASRRRRVHEQSAAISVAGDPGAIDDLIRDEERRRVRLILADMKPGWSQLLLMRADGCSYKELATAMGVRVSSIGTLLARAEADFEKRYLQQMRKEETNK